MHRIAISTGFPPGSTGAGGFSTGFARAEMGLLWDNGLRIGHTSHQRYGDSRGFCADVEVAGGHRPDCGRVREAAQKRSAEFSGTVPVPSGEDTVVFGTRHAAVLSLLWVRGVGRCVQLRPEDREYYVPRSRATHRREVEDSTTED